MREHNVPEKYVKLIQDMYSIEAAKERCAVQQAKEAASMWMWGCTKDLP